MVKGVVALNGVPEVVQEVVALKSVSDLRFGLEHPENRTPILACDICE